MVQRKRSRKSSLRKRSLRKKSRKRSQSGGGLFNWYNKVNRSDCLSIANTLIRNNNYKEPNEFIHDYSSAISKKSGGVAKIGNVFKSGFFTLLSGSTASFYAANVAFGYSWRRNVIKNDKKIKKAVGFEGSNEAMFKKMRDDEKFAMKVQKLDNKKGNFETQEQMLGKSVGTWLKVYSLVWIAIIAGVAFSNIRGKSKQGKMILQCACDAWNDHYDKKISINYIKKVIKGNPLAHKVMKDVKNSKVADIKKAEAQDKLHF